MLRVPERGINLALRPDSQRLASEVSHWIMAQARTDFVNFCGRLSAYAIGMSEECWITRGDYRRLSEFNLQAHEFGQHIRAHEFTASVRELQNWFRLEYSRQNPSFIFELIGARECQDHS